MRRHPLHRLRGLAVRKIVRARRLVAVLNTTVAVSAALSILGISCYLAVYPSDVVLVEAFVWFVEAFTFLGLAVAFNTAAQRAMTRMARLEVLRLESLATLLLSVVGIAVTLLVGFRAIVSPHTEPTPLPLSVYPLASAAASLALERRLRQAARRHRVRLVSIDAVARKLGLDVVFEVGGGLSIVASNVTGDPLLEAAATVAIAAYIVYGLASLAYETTQYLIGTGPRHVIESTRTRVKMIVLRRLGRPPLHMRVEPFGTFSEVEVWVEASPRTSLQRAHEISIMLARDIVREIPEVVRALVIVVPWTRERLRPMARRLTIAAAAGEETLRRTAREAPRPRPVRLPDRLGERKPRRRRPGGIGVKETTTTATSQQDGRNMMT